MAEKRITTERELMAQLLDSAVCKQFRDELLPHKIDREARAWDLLKEHRGRYTREILNSIFDTVDSDPKGRPWFGAMLATPNRQRILQTPDEVINRWIDELLFKGRPYREALDVCLGPQKLSGTGKGLATLLLYLSDSSAYNVWVNATEKGLTVVRRISKLTGNDLPASYGQFNQAAVEFRSHYDLHPAEMDWLLSFLGSHVVAGEDHFRVHEDALAGKKTISGGDKAVKKPDPNGVRYWKIAPGEKAWNWEACLNGGFIAIGWDELGDLSEMDRTQFEKRAKALVEQHDNWTLGGVEQAWRFAQIREGDRIVANRGTTEVLGIGTVCGPYEYVRAERHRHRLPVKWEDATRRRISEPGWRKAIIELRLEKFKAIRTAPPVDGGRVTEVRNSSPVYSLETCGHETGIDLPTLIRWRNAIERKGQAVLYGPPGTGKTFAAEHIARHLVGGGDGFVRLVQFHPAYAYEDFIQGIRPMARENGGLDYPVVPGRFLDFCRGAQDCTGRCVLIVDEINRANLSRVFGELMYLLEYRDREVPLAAGGSFRIPSNVRLLGTMNTADRSIALVDHALRRRFAFLALYPNYDILRKYHETTGFPVDPLIQVLRRLNLQIGDKHYEIGISFFLVHDLRRALEDIWRMEIEPYLEEFFFDQQARVDTFRWEQVGSELLP